MHWNSRVIIGLCLLAMASSITGCGRFKSREARAAERELRATELTASGQQAWQSGDLDSALDSFNAALEIEPEFVPAIIGVGDVYQEQGDLNTAAERFREAQELEPQSFDPNYKLAVALQLLNRVGEAAGNYLQALTIDPSNFEANSNLSTAYMQMRQPGLAVPYAERAAELNNEAQPPLLNLASVYAALGRYDDAIDAYRGAAERGDLPPAATVDLARIHLLKGSIQRALNTLRVLTQTHPQYARGHERLGYVYFKLAEYARSRTAYERALELDANDTSSLNGLGVNQMATYVISGREDISIRNTALATWQRSLQINPDQPRIVDLYKRYGG